MHVSRFTITNYLPENSGSLSAEYQTVFDSYCERIQSLLSSSINSLIENKVTSNLFLDKIHRYGYIGDHNPKIDKVKGYTMGAETAASIEMIRLLEIALKDSSLTEEERLCIQEWIDGEKEIFFFTVLFDGWRGCSNDLRDFFSTTDPDQRFNIQNSITKIEPLNDEIDIFVSYLIEKLKKMEVGDTLKIPAGSLLHETRWVITKSSSTSYDLTEFETALGITFTCFSEIPADNLENSDFWKKFVEAKMNRNDTGMHDLLSSLNISQKNIPAKRQKELQKTQQELNTCSAACIKAEFKHFLVSRGNWTLYKKMICLITQAATQDSEGLDSDIKEMVTQKESYRKRYLHWFRLIGNPSEYDSIIEEYHRLFAEHKVNLSSSLENVPPLQRLHIYHKGVEQLALKFTYSQLMKMRERYSSIATFNEVNFLGLKSLMWVENARNFFMTTLTDYKSHLDHNKNQTNTASLTDLMRFAEDYIKAEELSYLKKVVLQLKECNLLTQDLISPIIKVIFKQIDPKELLATLHDTLLEHLQQPDLLNEANIQIANEIYRVDDYNQIIMFTDSVVSNDLKLKLVREILLKAMISKISNSKMELISGLLI